MEIEAKLKSLESEYEAAQRMLAELETKRARLTQTMLRIEGAMLVLRELIAGAAAKGEPPGGGGAF